jgi:hypothetical protein
VDPLRVALWTNFAPESLHAVIVVNQEIERIAALNLVKADADRFAAQNNSASIIAERGLDLNYLQNQEEESYWSNRK